jgi:hypothetical protein
LAKRGSRKRDKDIRLSEAQLRQPGAERLVPVEKGDAGPAQPEAFDLAEEYRYVTADLKRIAIIAAVMLTVLIVLALALP